MLRKAFSYIQIWHAVALLVMVLDQISKHLVQRILTYGDTQTITAFFDIVHVHNSGVAFGILANMGGAWKQIFLSAVAAFACGLVLYLLQQYRNRTTLCLAFSLVLGGAAGNLYDRIHLGYVIDFLSIHYHQWYWPAFNLADSAISLAMVLLIWSELHKNQLLR